MKRIKYFLFRKRLNLPGPLPPNLKFRIAKTKEDYYAAAKILYESYLEKGYTAQNESGMRITPFHLLPTTIVLLALWDNEIVGTVSLVRDNPLSLPLEKIFELSGLRAQNKIICEVSSLAIKRDFRGKSGALFYPLVKFMWNYALNFFGVDYLVIAVNPSMHELYESIFLFEPLQTKAVCDSYDFANNNPAIGEYINLKTSYEQFHKKYGGVPHQRNLYEFMKKEIWENIELPSREYYTHNDSPVQVNWVRDFIEHIPEFDKDPELKNKLANAFGYQDYEHLILQSGARGQRIPVTFEITNIPEAQVVDVSENGLRLVGGVGPLIQNTSIFNIKIAKDKTAKVLAEPVWQANSRGTGFRILDCSEPWLNMLGSTLKNQVVPSPKLQIKNRRM